MKSQHLCWFQPLETHSISQFIVMSHDQSWSFIRKMAPQKILEPTDIANTEASHHLVTWFSSSFSFSPFPSSVTGHCGHCPGASANSQLPSAASMVSPSRRRRCARRSAEGHCRQRQQACKTALELMAFFCTRAILGIHYIYIYTLYIYIYIYTLYIYIYTIYILYIYIYYIYTIYIYTIYIYIYICLIINPNWGWFMMVDVVLMSHPQGFIVGYNLGDGMGLGLETTWMDIKQLWF